MRPAPSVPTPSPSSGRQSRALTVLHWLCLVTPVLTALAAAIWMKTGTPHGDWLSELAFVLPGAAALLLIWRLVQAGARNELSRFPAHLQGAGAALLAGALLSGLIAAALDQEMWRSQVSFPAALLMLAGVLFAALPGLGLLVLARVMATVVRLKQDEDLTV